MSTTPLDPHQLYQRTVELREEIARHRPAPEAGKRIRVRPQFARTCYLQQQHLSGPRDDVLGYAAYLFESDRTLELVAIEEDTPEKLTILLSKATYAG